MVILDPDDIKGTIGAPSPCPICSPCELDRLHIGMMDRHDTLPPPTGWRVARTRTERKRGYKPPIKIDPAIAADPDWPNRAVGELDKTYMDLLNLLSISIP